MSDKAPISSNVVFPKVQEILNMGWIDIPQKFNGSGAPGNTLETLLNVDENNLDSPDLLDWEVKFHGGSSLLTLFHKTPMPRGIMNKVVDEFGWLNDRGQMSFRHTIRGKSERGFDVVSEDDKIVVKNHNNLTIQPYWNHNTLLNALAAKLRRLVLFEGTYNSQKRKVNYQKATAYWDVDIIKFCNSIEKGLIYVDFDARTKGERGTRLRDHGTKFRINIKDIGSIYMSSQQIKESTSSDSEGLSLF
jgi:hypothetical protein